MIVTNYTDFRKNLAQIMDEILSGHVPAIITRESKQPLVMMSLEDFNGHQETFYLTKSKTNKNRLAASLKNIEKGKYKKHKLIEC
ncbi:MAG: type II toxin-antitoxin system prevent-host-death family antitoxin [Rickettsiales bacterium]|nr:type II toxin-antitoxin system prevent-host-death family antitoxin [Rickettsiales bacterium]